MSGVVRVGETTPIGNCPPHTTVVVVAAAAAIVNGKYDSEFYYSRRSPSDATELSRESAAASTPATREPISMVISRRPIVEYMLNMHVHGDGSTSNLSLSLFYPYLSLLREVVETCQSISDGAR